MNKITPAVISVLFLLSAPHAFACDYPQRVGVPDGATATKEEMIEGQRGIKDYIASMEAYLACIEAAEQETVANLNESDDSSKQQRIGMFNKKYNAAVEEMNLVAEEFIRPFILPAVLLAVNCTGWRRNSCFQTGSCR